MNIYWFIIGFISGIIITWSIVKDHWEDMERKHLKYKYEKYMRIWDKETR